jgi:alpha-tubulin suppressor-like RCC1 family protein
MSNSAGRIEITENTLLKLLIRRGSNTERTNVVLSEGELGYTVDTRRLFVGDGVTTGALPTSLFLYFGTGHPSTWAAEAEAGDVAYDSIAGGIYRLAAKPYSTAGNWTLFSGPLANRVDDETLQLNATTGVMSVKTVSAAQLDTELAGLGLEFVGARELQTTANQQFDQITPRNNAFLQLSQAIQFGAAGGAAVFNMPAFDGAAGSVLTTDSFGNLVFATPGTYQTQYMVLSSNQVPVGSIVPYGSGGNFNATSTTVPHGYFLCDGSTKDGTVYSALCAAIGQYYGGTGTNFNVPLLTASNFVYIIKYLQDVIFEPSTVTVDNVALTAYNVTTDTSTTNLVFPNQGIQYQLGINDYISKTAVDSQISSLSATVDVLQSQNPRFASRIIIPTLNTGTTMVCYKHGFVLDAANNVRGAGNSDTATYGSAIGYGSNNVDVPFFFSIAVGFSANEYAISAYSIGNFSALLTSEGNVYTAGKSSVGLLGAGATTVNNTFKQINPLYFNYEKVTQIAGSYTNASDAVPEVCMFAITDAGNLYGWGEGSSGCLGIGSTTDQTTPVKINETIYIQDGNYSSLSALKVKKVTTSNSAATQFAFVIDENDELHAAGNNQNGNLGLTNKSNRTIFYKVSANISTVNNVYAGGYTTNSNAYVTTDDKNYLWSVGSFNSGALGNNAVADQTVFKPVSSVSGAFQLSGVVALTINADSTNLLSIAARLTGNNIVTWGENGAYQLGDGTTTDRTIPKVPLAPFTGIKKIQYHTDTLFMLTTAGELYSVGGVNTDGAAGDGTTTAATTTKTKAVKIQRNKFDDFIVIGYASNKTVYAITDSVIQKDLYAWGKNTNGQCGLPTSIANVLVPTLVQL